MTDEVVLPTPAVEPEAGATAALAEATVSVDDKPSDPPKTYTQEELEKVVAKERARAERKATREAEKRIAEAAKAQPAPVTGGPVKPDISKFTDVAEYDKAMEKYADEKAGHQKAVEAEESRKATAKREKQEIMAAYAEREDDAVERYSDYIEVTRNPRLAITDSMFDALTTADNGTDIAYHLGKNPEEAKRIAALSPTAQAREIGKLEAKLLAAPPAKKTSAAPPPITPVTPRGSQGYVDTTDPKALEKLGTSAWIEADRARRRREMAARNR